MQNFSGISMVRRRKQASETKVKMEGSSEDSEPQILARFAKDLQQSINMTQSTLVHHLQENQETVCRGQVEMTKTLRKVNEIQERITQLLMKMNQGGKGLEIYANKEASGSHVETRHQQENIPHYHNEGYKYGGGAPLGQTHSRTTPRPYLPSFLDNQTQPDYQDEIEENFAQYAREYNSLSAGIQRKITLEKYCGIKFRGKPKPYHRNNYELECRVGKMEISYFDGSFKVTA
jgi:hypothetical protein